MITTSYPRYGGDIAGTFVRDIASHVAALGHDVEIVVPDDGPPANDLPITDPGVLVHRVAYAPTQRLRLVGYGKSLEGDRRLRRSAYVMIGPYAVLSLLALVNTGRRQGCDIIHAHWGLPNGFVAAFARRILDRPLVIQLHGSDVYVAERNVAFRLASRLAFHVADGVVTNSSNLRDRAIRLGADPLRTELIFGGASLEKFVGRSADGAKVRQGLGIRAESPVVLALGRLVYKKGFEYLIEAFPTVVRRWPDAKLIVGGDGYLADELRDRATAHGIGEAVLMPGRIPADDVPAYIAAADVFVMPAVTDVTGNVDGLPHVVPEAMAGGCPVVGTSVGGMRDVMIDGVNGLLVSERSPGELSAAIARLLADPDERRRLGQGGQRLVEQRLNWPAIAREYLSLYERTQQRFHSSASET